MVYEMNIASLSDILSIRPHWGHAETDAVCHNILSALKYLRNNLNISHGDLRLENIRLDWNGTVQLGRTRNSLPESYLTLTANIGDTLLRAKRAYNEDIRSLGSIVQRLSGVSNLRADGDLSDFLRKLDGGQPASTLLLACHRSCSI